METAVFGAGCFWCVEAIFASVKGVQAVEPGYSGGSLENPSYSAVCTGETGHAEVVKIDFDPQIVSYETLLDIFFHTHDPTSLNRQGNDVGTQYRSVVYHLDRKQEKSAQVVLKKVKQEALWQNEIVTQFERLEKYYPAEAYHAEYFENNPHQPYCALVVAPKVKKFQKKYKSLLK